MMQVQEDGATIFRVSAKLFFLSLRKISCPPKPVLRVNLKQMCYPLITQTHVVVSLWLITKLKWYSPVAVYHMQRCRIQFCHTYNAMTFKLLPWTGNQKRMYWHTSLLKVGLQVKKLLYKIEQPHHVQKLVKERSPEKTPNRDQNKHSSLPLMPSPARDRRMRVENYQTASNGRTEEIRSKMHK